MKLGIDLSSVPEFKPYSFVEPGRHPVKVVKVEVKSPKSGIGSYLEVTMDLVSGFGSLVERLNIEHENPKVVRISMSKIKSMVVCSGSNKTVINDSSELVGLCFDVLVGEETEMYEGKEQKRNKILEFFKSSVSAPASSVSAPAPVAGSDSPWFKH